MEGEILPRIYNPTVAPASGRSAQASEPQKVPPDALIPQPVAENHHAAAPQGLPVNMTTLLSDPLRGPAMVPVIPTTGAKGIVVGGNPQPDSARSSTGILGRVSGQQILLDLSYPKLMAVFGQMGSGKSYLAGVLTEMSAMSISGISHFPVSECAVVVFNYRQNRDARFEYSSYTQGNDSERELKVLRDLYGVESSALPPDRFNVCAYEPEIRARQNNDYAGIRTCPLLFRPQDLEDSDWELLMGVPDPDAVYIQVIRHIIEDLGYAGRLSLRNIATEVHNTNNLSDGQKLLANMRLNEFAARYVNETRGLDWATIVRPGTVTIIDLRRRGGVSNDALRLCLVVLSCLRHLDRRFHKFCLFDEFHEYYSTEFSDALGGMARMLRGLYWTICLATQNTHKIDKNLLRLFSNKFIFQVDGKTCEELIEADSRLQQIDDFQRKITSLPKESGECYMLFDDCTDSRYRGVPTKLNVRPRVTRHGGRTMGQT